MPSTKSYCDISLYAADGTQVRYINAIEARELVANGGHEFFCVSCKKVKGEGPCLVATNHLMAVRQVAEELEELGADDESKGESECSLTLRDMQRNVGITQGYPGQPANQGEIKVTRRRLKYWGTASLGFPGKPDSGNRAITVVPREFVRRDRRAREHAQAVSA
jgi:hypothetical protein